MDNGILKEQSDIQKKIKRKHGWTGEYQSEHNDGQQNSQRSHEQIGDTEMDRRTPKGNQGQSELEKNSRIDRKIPKEYMCNQDNTKRIEG